MMNWRPVVQISLLVIASAFQVGCQSADEIANSDKQIATAKPLESKARSFEKVREVKASEPDFVSEDIAQAAMVQLSSWGKEGEDLRNGLLYCAALRSFRVSGKPSTCFGDDDDEESGTTCLMKRGIGKKSVGQALTADKFDLNADGVPDLVLSDRYHCKELSANQANVYLVMLSQPSGSHRLSYANWASYGLEVVRDPTTKANVLVERAPKSYGTFTRILHLVDGRYAPRACVLEDEKGLHKCE